MNTAPDTPTAPADAPTYPPPHTHESWLAGRHGQTRYWATRPRHGLPLLLIHGFAGLIEHWRPVLPLLAATDTVYALDLHNLGYSDHLRGVAPSVPLWGEQAAHLIRACIGEPVIVVGHSMGGLVSMQLAASQPDLVRGLVLVNSLGVPRRQRATPLERLIVGLLGMPGLGEVAANLVPVVPAVRRNVQATYYDPAMVTPARVEMFSGPLRRAGGPQAYLEILRQAQRFQRELPATTIRQPALIIWGAEDRSIPVAQAEQLRAQRVPQASIELIPRSGHCPFDETPQAFGAALTPWLAQFRAGPPA